MLGERWQGQANLVKHFEDNKDQLMLIRDALSKLYDVPILFEDHYIDDHIIYGQPDHIVKVDNPDEFTTGMVVDEAEKKVDGFKELTVPRPVDVLEKD